MKHVVIAMGVALLTIGVSVLLLSENNADYQSDAKINKNVSIGQIFEGENYNLLPIDFDCREFSALSNEEETRHGCVLSVAITNTSIFEQQLILDGDSATGVGGEKYESSHELSKKFIKDNELIASIAVDEIANGGIFFDVPSGVVIEELEIYDGTDNEPIIISL